MRKCLQCLPCSRMFALVCTRHYLRNSSVLSPGRNLYAAAAATHTTPHGSCGRNQLLNEGAGTQLTNCLIKSILKWSINPNSSISKSCSLGLKMRTAIWDTGYTRLGLLFRANPSIRISSEIDGPSHQKGTTGNIITGPEKRL